MDAKSRRGGFCSCSLGLLAAAVFLFISMVMAIISIVQEFGCHFPLRINAGFGIIKGFPVWTESMAWLGRGQLAVLMVKEHA